MIPVTLYWNDRSTYDIETVALHEAGHGLSQGHFGKAFRTVKNGKLHFSPRAVMNAAILEFKLISKRLTKQDIAAIGHNGQITNLVRRTIKKIANVGDLFLV